VEKNVSGLIWHNHTYWLRQTEAWHKLLVA